ncbi:S8 family serine peptidase [Pseudidiomarina sp. 1APP75-32.1]|uniref:S8 family serine peptidase n=1 Tax=Pseudidiomarina terrestris TaxID=2820060 RepID=A0AAW7QX23_9GAMM|nr:MULTISPECIES: S8 family serine peptidase [unclassified Pseudidiomarina]MDN7124775.1 S8 family serine peptidase [Pseudidiomarina sp. 1APP75-32.1]MDN7129751.1 S8 family serine peptidase [Pseudidiomarina sp. 1APR75-15]
MNVMKMLLIIMLIAAGLAPISQAQVLRDVPQLPQQLPQLPETLEQLRENAKLETSKLPRRAGHSVLTSIESVTTHLTEVLPAVFELTDAQGNLLLREVSVEDGWRALEREWLMVIEVDEVQLLQKLPIEVLGQRELAALELTVVRFRVPAHYDSRQALSELLPEFMQATLARQHIYFAQDSGTSAEDLPANSNSGVACEDPLTLGAIDTRIDTGLSYFAEADIHQRSFLDDEFAQPLAHGTAIAGLWLGKGEELQPLVPNARLLAAAVFYEHNSLSQGAPVSALIEALDWLVAEGVRVINMSLTGPDNAILRVALQRAHASGTIIVAAAGNAGPAAPPLYPAAYDKVIAVTAVDVQQRVYPWANRGRHIEYAALGVDVTTVRGGGGLTAESGTSMAAPVVSALLSCVLADSAEARETSIADKLSPYLQDLGAPGPDPIFGRGLLTPGQPPL